MHNNNIKLGLTTSAGEKTCNGRPGSKGHEMHDAQSYAEWKVDYVYMDDCGAEGAEAMDTFNNPFAKMQKELKKTGREIFFAVDNGGKGNALTWQKQI